MATIVERDSSSPVAAVLIFVLFAILVVGGLWFAYANGIFGRPSVVENNKTFVLPGAPAQNTPSSPAPSTPEPAPAK